MSLKGVGICRVGALMPLDRAYGCVSITLNLLGGSRREGSLCFACNPYSKCCAMLDNKKARLTMAVYIFALCNTEFRLSLSVHHSCCHRIVSSLLLLLMFMTLEMQHDSSLCGLSA